MNDLPIDIKQPQAVTGLAGGRVNCITDNGPEREQCRAYMIRAAAI